MRIFSFAQFWAGEFGISSRLILQKVRSFVPDTVFAEAREHLPEILLERNISDPKSAMAVLDELAVLIDCIDAEIYRPFEVTVRQRLRNRGEDDWQVLATARALECPIWTEDTEFFGAGVGTWTTDRVALLLSELAADISDRDDD